MSYGKFVVLDIPILDFPAADPGLETDQSAISGARGLKV
jgi:hypothetical protein